MTNLLLKEYYISKKINIVKFFIRRMLRIWPLYFFIMFLTILVVLPGNIQPHPGASTSQEQWQWFEKDYWKYFLFIGNWWQHFINEFGILWTICVEEQFYLILPFIATFAFKANKKTLLLVLTCIACGYIWRVAFVIKPALVKNQLYYLTPTYIDSFVYGGLAAWLYRFKINIPIINSKIIIFLICCGTIFACYVGGHQVWWATYGYKTVLSYGFIPIVASLLILHLSICQGNRPNRIFSSSIMKILGVLSFGIYLWHTLVHRMINIQVACMNFESTPMNGFIHTLLFAEYCLLSILLASLTFKFVEMPFLRLRGRLYKENIHISSARWKIPIRNIVLVCALSIFSIFLVFFMAKLF